MIYFIIYLLLETLFSVEISSQIGGLNTFLEIVLSVIIGIYIFKNLKYNLVSTIQDFTTGGIDINQLKSRNIFPIVGAILLIIPGFLTDSIGLLLQFSFFTDLLIKKVNTPNTHFDDVEVQDSFQDKNYKPNFKYDDDIIDVNQDSDKKN